MAYALIPAAGRAARFQSGGPTSNKVFAPLAGKPVLRWAAEAFAAHAQIEGIIVVSGPEEAALCRSALDGVEKVMAIVPGGKSRQESVAIGLFALGGEADDLVLVHDGARPLISAEVISRCLGGAMGLGNAVAALPVADTLKAADDMQVITRTIDRTGMWAVQTPQAFRLKTLYEAHSAAREWGWEGTDEASLVEKFTSEQVHLVMGDPVNLKITRPEDLRLAEAIVSSERSFKPMQTRIGFGYDIHPFAEGRRLFLGGIQIPHTHGLDGHSDADVLLHALCDALLGAAGLPDIGNLFPNTDAAYKDIASIKLLRQVKSHLSGQGYQVGNVDITIIAETPKIAAYVPQMRQVIAEALEVKSTQVGIKATTNEGLGALGRGEGIAAHAVAAITTQLGS